MKICRGNQKLVKIGEKYPTLYFKLSMLYCIQQHKFSVKIPLYNTQYFYIVGSDVDQQ